MKNKPVATVQVVENSDRFHVSMDGTPHRTFLFSAYPGKETALLHAEANAYRLTLSLQGEDYNVILKPQEVK